MLPKELPYQLLVLLNKAHEQRPRLLGWGRHKAPAFPRLTSLRQKASHPSTGISALRWIIISVGDNGSAGLDTNIEGLNAEAATVLAWIGTSTVRDQITVAAAMTTASPIE